MACGKRQEVGGACVLCFVGRQVVGGHRWRARTPAAPTSHVNDATVMSVVIAVRTAGEDENPGFQALDMHRHPKSPTHLIRWQRHRAAQRSTASSCSCRASGSGLRGSAAMSGRLMSRSTCPALEPIGHVGLLLTPLILPQGSQQQPHDTRGASHPSSSLLGGTWLSVVGDGHGFFRCFPIRLATASTRNH